MLFKNKILSLILICAFSLGLNVYGSRSSVKAKLDSTILMMGKITTMELIVDQAKGEKGSFPLFSKLKDNGIVGVCGDSVELRAPVRADTSEQSGRLKIKYIVPVQAFDSGYYKLPEIEFVIGRDTSFSNSVALKVVPVVVDANAPIDDYANVADPENQSIFDNVPDWMINYWWIILIVLISIAVFLYAWRKYKKDGQLIGKKYIPTPYEIASEALKELKSKKLWEQGMEKEYFTELTDILRNYMYGRFGINAMEMTSRQIINSLKNNEETNDKRAYIRQILNMADFVKFAKVRPLPADNVASFDNAVKFVEETKPVPLEENADKDASSPKQKGNDSKQKGGKI